MTQTSQPRISQLRTSQPWISQPWAVLGAGAWGTVLAALLAGSGREVRLWARRLDQAEAIGRTRRNAQYLPDFALPDSLHASSDLSAVVAGARAVVVALPSRALREVLAELPPVRAVVSACKGLEPGSFKRPSELVAEYQPRALLGALSGPNLSHEIARGLPAAATLAAPEPDFAEEAQIAFGGERFRVYTSADLVGLEVAGAFKNVIALAAGLSDGLGFGDNSKATLITRGLAELVRLGTQLGGEPQTFYGLAGLGDLVATCAGPGSRNHRAGLHFARGGTLEGLEASGLTAEGVPTVRAVQGYAAGRLELPIAQEVYRVVYEGKAPEEALGDLMGRAPRAEG